MMMNLVRQLTNQVLIYKESIILETQYLLFDFFPVEQGNIKLFGKWFLCCVFVYFINVYVCLHMLDAQGGQNREVGKLERELYLELQMVVNYLTWVLEQPQILWRSSKNF